ncbi:hypothetical protein JAAARDRAFT_196390 [Jaapia argillacea MUCL 33604]|uniref:FAD dependent oxidoreductase domain-containing protein n=1 Tax=Jaapia argillacea MUCL 33604 TaxID=933084 RepID=A0A067PHV5_9AGAM|nr:hypothetical protein JAAARDRAFT_196390 [Jaapia argillacea MUCL 33604]
MDGVVSAISELKLLWTTVTSLNRAFDDVKGRAKLPPGLPVDTSVATTSVWQHVDQRVLNIPPKPLPDLVDILIIGSGISACAIAKTVLHDFDSECRKQSEKPLSIAIVDARDICSGATGRNGGQIKESAYMDYSALLKQKKSPETAKTISRFRINHRKRLMKVAKEMKVREQCEVREVDTVDAFFSAGAWKEAQEQLRIFQKAFGDEAGHFEVLQKEAARAKYHLMGVHGAIVGRAGALSPYRLTTSIFSRLLEDRDSLTLHPNTVVTDICCRADGLYTVTTAASSQDETRLPTKPETSSESKEAVPDNQRTIRARMIIHATNAYASNLLPGLTSKIIPVRGQMTCLRPLPSAEHQSLCKTILSPDCSWSFVFDKGFDYLATRPCGDVMLGGGWAQGSGGGLDDVGISSDADNSVLASSHLLGLLPTVFDKKVLTGVDVKGVWSGAIGMSADLLPWVGQVPESVSKRKGGSNAKGEWVCAGFSGEGMVNAWGCGEALAKMVVEKFRCKPVGKIRDHLVLPPDMIITESRVCKASLSDLAKAWD